MALSLDGTTGIVTANIGNSQVTAGKLASGAARANFGAGAVLQVVQGVNTNVQNQLTSSTFADIPNLSATITPSNTSNKVLVIVSLYGSSSSNAGVRLMRDSTPIGVSTNPVPGNRKQGSTADFYANASNTGESVNFTFLDSPNSQSAVVYKMQYFVNAGSSFCLNANYLDTDYVYTTRGISTITLMEIAG
jgi:hypothetical protein